MGRVYRYSFVSLRTLTSYNFAASLSDWLPEESIQQRGGDEEDASKQTLVTGLARLAGKFPFFDGLVGDPRSESRPLLTEDQSRDPPSSHYLTWAAASPSALGPFPERCPVKESSSKGALRGTPETQKTIKKVSSQPGKCTHYPESFLLHGNFQTTKKVSSQPGKSSHYPESFLTS